jgi:hypothetical protein
MAGDAIKTEPAPLHFGGLSMRAARFLLSAAFLQHRSGAPARCDNWPTGFSVAVFPYEWDWRKLPELFLPRRRYPLKDTP